MVKKIKNAIKPFIVAATVISGIVNRIVDKDRFKMEKPAINNASYLETRQLKCG
jgi:hypothetical protein